MIDDITLETNRLILRRVLQDDLLDLHEITCQKDVVKMCGWKLHKNIEETQELLDNCCDKNVFGIVLKDNNKLIGLIEYVENETLKIDNKKGMELAFVLSNNYWGHEYMVEAIKRIVQYGFCALELEYVLVGYLVDNYQSRRVVEKCGFKYIKNVKYVSDNEVFDTRTCILYNN